MVRLGSQMPQRRGAVRLRRVVALSFPLSAVCVSFVLASSASSSGPLGDRRQSAEAAPTSGSPTVPTAQGRKLTSPPDATWGGRAELRDTAVLVWRLIHEGKFAQARAACACLYDSARDEETRALALRGIAEAYREEFSSERAIEIFKQGIEEFPESSQVSWAKLDLAETCIDRSELMQREQSIAAATRLLQASWEADDAAAHHVRKRDGREFSAPR
jgi:hypothetical protein